MLTFQKDVRTEVGVLQWNLEGKFRKLSTKRNASISLCVNFTRLSNERQAMKSLKKCSREDKEENKH